MWPMASQITSLTIVYSIVYSGADQRKHQSPASLAFMGGIHRWPVNSPHKWLVTRKMFPFDDIILCFVDFKFRALCKVARVFVFCSKLYMWYACVNHCNVKYGDPMCMRYITGACFLVSTQNSGTDDDPSRYVHYSRLSIYLGKI